jgi:hypothetical protein
VQQEAEEEGARVLQVVLGHNATVAPLGTAAPSPITLLGSGLRDATSRRRDATGTVYLTLQDSGGPTVVLHAAAVVRLLSSLAPCCIARLSQPSERREGGLVLGVLVELVRGSGLSMRTRGRLTLTLTLHTGGGVRRGGARCVGQRWCGRSRSRSALLVGGGLAERDDHRLQ